MRTKVQILGIIYIRFSLPSNVFLPPPNSNILKTKNKRENKAKARGAQHNIIGGYINSPYINNLILDNKLLSSGRLGLGLGLDLEEWVGLVRGIANLKNPSLYRF